MTPSRGPQLRLGVPDNNGWSRTSRSGHVAPAPPDLRRQAKKTESLRLVAELAAPDPLGADLQAHLSPTEIVAVTAAVAMINDWNRMAIATGAVHPAERAHRA